MGSVFRQKGRKVWMIRYYDCGRPRFESSGSEVKDEATKLLKQREGDIAHDRPVIHGANRLRFDEAVKDVSNDYAVNGHATATNLEIRIRLHLMPVFGGRRMSTITTADIRQYSRDRLAAGAKPATVNRELAIIRRAFSMAVKGGRLGAKPHIPMLQERNTRQGFFEAEQFEAVRRHLPAEWQPVMTFAYHTGWRTRSEILPLTWAQVDSAAKTVRLEPETSKNREARTFPCGALPALADVLTAQAAVRDAFKARGIITPYVFPDAAGGRLPAFYAPIWREACRQAGVPGRIPHDLRRSAARAMVQAGIGESVAMKLMGHKTASIFRRYAIVSPRDLTDAVAKLAATPPAAPPKRGRQRMSLR